MNQSFSQAIETILIFFSKIRRGLIVALLASIVVFFVLPSSAYIGGTVENGTVTRVNAKNDEPLPLQVTVGDKSLNLRFQCVVSGGGGPYSKVLQYNCGLEEGEDISFLLSRDRMNAATASGAVGILSLGTLVVAVVGSLVWLGGLRKQS